MVIKQYPFWECPFLDPHFYGDIVDIGLFDFPRTSGSGHHGRMGASLDVGTTLAGSSDENIGLISGMSARSLTAIRHFAVGSSAFSG